MWECSVCTFLCSPSYHLCEMCGTSKLHSSSSSSTFSTNNPTISVVGKKHKMIIPQFNYDSHNRRLYTADGVRDVRPGRPPPPVDYLLHRPTQSAKKSFDAGFALPSSSTITAASNEATDRKQQQQQQQQQQQAQFSSQDEPKTSEVKSSHVKDSSLISTNRGRGRGNSSDSRNNNGDEENNSEKGGRGGRGGGERRGGGGQKRLEKPRTNDGQESGSNRNSRSGSSSRGGNNRVQSGGRGKGSGQQDFRNIASSVNAGGGGGRGTVRGGASGATISASGIIRSSKPNESTSETNSAVDTSDRRTHVNNSIGGSGQISEGASRAGNVNDIGVSGKGSNVASTSSKQGKESGASRSGEFESFQASKNEHRGPTAKVDNKDKQRDSDNKSKSTDSRMNENISKDNKRLANVGISSSSSSTSTSLSSSVCTATTALASTIPASVSASAPATATTSFPSSMKKFSPSSLSASALSFSPASSSVGSSSSLLGRMNDVSLHLPSASPSPISTAATSSSSSSFNTPAAITHTITTAITTTAVNNSMSSTSSSLSSCSSRHPEVLMIQKRYASSFSFSSSIDTAAATTTTATDTVTTANATNIITTTAASTITAGIVTTTASPSSASATPLSTEQFSFTFYPSDPDFKFELSEGLSLRFTLPPDFPFVDCCVRVMSLSVPYYVRASIEDAISRFQIQRAAPAAAAAQKVRYGPSPSQTVLRDILKFLDRSLQSLMEIGIEQEERLGKPKPSVLSLDNNKEEKKKEEEKDRSDKKKEEREEEEEEEEEEENEGEEEEEEDDVWSEKEQRDLEKGLKKFPSSLVRSKKTLSTSSSSSSSLMSVAERWKQIAEVVKTKNVKQCVSRYQFLREQLFRKQVEKLKLRPPPSSASSSSSSSSSAHEEDKDDIKLFERSSSSSSSSVYSARKGTVIGLTNLQLKGVSLLRVICLQLQISCLRCGAVADVSLTPTILSQAVCEGCGLQRGLRLRAELLHAHCSVVGSVEVQNVQCADYLPSDFFVTCENCNEDLKINLSRAQPCSYSCQACHSAITLHFLDVEFTVLPGGNAVLVEAPSLAPASTVMRKRVVRDKLILGTPLPKKGACSHFKRSFRWLRFPCCGKAYPCPLCHEKGENGECDTKWANRMICGLCSKEQAFSQSACVHCGVYFSVQHKNQWEGGKGCRDRVKMSVNSSKKYAGLNKTVSAKSQRVGDPKHRPSADD